MEELAAILQSELVLQVLAVRLHRLYANTELLGNLSIRRPGADELEYLQFPVRKSLCSFHLPTRGAVKQPPEQGDEDLRAQVNPSAQHAANRLKDFRGVGGLHDITDCPGP